MGGFSNVLGSLSVAISADIDDYLADLGKVGDEAGKAVGEVEKQFSGLTEIGTQMAGLGAGLTAGITVPLAGLAALSIDAAGDMDSLMRGLTAIAGSSEEAGRQMERLKEVAKLPGLGLEEAVQGSIRLQAVGTSAQDAEKYMMQFGNALATVGKGRADLDAVITQLVQMASKTNVVAEDLKPIMERVPQVASILKEAYGTIDTEQLSKAGKTTTEVIGTIVKGLEELPRVSGGIKNSFENLEDSSKQALAEIGKAFTPLIQIVTPAIESLLESVKQAAQWFTQLPGPVQAAIGTFVAFGAALGPILVAIGGITAAIGLAMPALTAVATFFGTSVALLAPWALAIGAVLAALVALGVWVNANWEPIVAVLSTAWDGIQENWTAVWNAITGAVTGVWSGFISSTEVIWGPIVTFFTTIWDAVAPYFTAAWNGIAGALSGVWEGIKTAASTVWGGIVGVFQTFLEWAEKIPGVNKLMNLDDAWSAAKKLGEETKKASEGTKDLKTSADAAAGSKSKPLPKLATALGTAKTSAKQLTEEYKPLIDKQTELTETARLLNAKHDDAEKKVAALKAEMERLKNFIPTMIGADDDLTEAIGDIIKKSTDLSTIAFPGVKSSTEAVKGATGDLNTALATLGTTSATQYNAVAANAKIAYDAVMGSNIATTWEKDNALIKMMEAQRQAAIANGEDIPKEYDDFLADLQGKFDTKVPQLETPWSTMATNVSTVFTNFAQDISKSLFDGDLSFGEKAKSMFTSLGQAVTSSFLEPATKAIGDFIGGAIKSLMGGEGLGGVLDKVKELGESVGKVFGIGADVADKVPGVPSVPDKVPGVPGTGGAGATAGAGLAGIVGAVGSVVSAISGVIGNFQMAKMETTLNAIEHETRYSQIHLKHILEDGVNKWLPKLAEIAGFNWDVFQPALASLMSTVESIPERLVAISDRLTDWLKPIYTESYGKWQLYEDRLYEISSNTFFGVEAMRQNTAMLAQIRDLLGSRPASVIIVINGAAGPQATADAVALKLQGVML
jgi:tape measure domain-containing protein